MFSMDVGEMNRSDCGSTSGLHMPASVCLTDTQSLFPVALPFSHALFLSISVSVHISASPCSARGQMINIIESETQTPLSQTASWHSGSRLARWRNWDVNTRTAGQWETPDCSWTFAFLVATSLAIAVKNPRVLWFRPWQNSEDICSTPASVFIREMTHLFVLSSFLTLSLMSRSAKARRFSSLCPHLWLRATWSEGDRHQKKTSVLLFEAFYVKKKTISELK